MTATHIRPARLEDAAALNELVRGLGMFKQINELAPEQSYARIKSHLEGCLADGSHSVYVAETDQGQILGYASVHWLPYLILTGPEGYVSELFVRGEARGQSIGTRLLEVVRQAAVEKGCKWLSLINNRSRESYQRGYYKKLGWEERQEYANFILPLDQE